VSDIELQRGPPRIEVIFPAATVTSFTQRSIPEIGVVPMEIARCGQREHWDRSASPCGRWGLLAAERFYRLVDGLLHPIEFCFGPDQGWADLDFSADERSGESPMLAQHPAELCWEGG
jgi:hypothetical protein